MGVRPVLYRLNSDLACDAGYKIFQDVDAAGNAHSK